MNEEERIKIEAATFRRLLGHLDSHKEVQNIDLMNLASFCRNCLSKWYSAEAKERLQKAQENDSAIETQFLSKKTRHSYVLYFLLLSAFLCALLTTFGLYSQFFDEESDVQVNYNQILHPEANI